VENCRAKRPDLDNFQIKAIIAAHVTSVKIARARVATVIEMGQIKSMRLIGTNRVLFGWLLGIEEAEVKLS
ncbi:hypothetical protein PanWU01x14_372080, partial [Parasponia andersonii]